MFDSPQLLQRHRYKNYDVHKQTFNVQGIDCANLEITCPGNNRNNDVILISAHYDSVLGSPGANDNGSGVAALLELSRLFKEVPLETSLRFVAFVNEEPPFFFWRDRGSMVMPKPPKNVAIRYVL